MKAQAIGFLTASVLCLVGGCPIQESARSLPSGSGIPAGTYRGETLMTAEPRVDGTLNESGVRTVTSLSVVTIDDDGRLVNTTTGQPAQVGDVWETTVGTSSIVATTTSITASGDTITERYDVVLNDSGKTFTGEGVDTYIYTGSSIEVINELSVGNDRVADGFAATIRATRTGTLTR